MFRKLFHYQHELMTMKTKMADLRERNESLVYNILPSHVALHFIGDKRNNDVCSVVQEAIALKHFPLKRERRRFISHSKTSF